MSAQSSAQGTTRSISARNAARRVVLAYFSNPVLASVICLLFILIPRPCLLSAEALPFRQVNRGLVQSFPRGNSTCLGLSRKKDRPRTEATPLRFSHAQRTRPSR